MTRLPLLWRVFLSTSLVTTVLFVLIGYIVYAHALRTTERMLEDELQASLQACESVWRARADHLASMSRVISAMPDVRASFGTGDSATIRDTAGEVWSRVSRTDAVFLVTDPTGLVIASLSGTPWNAPQRIRAVATASQSFPEQASGFLFLGDQLHQVVITPVYVDAGGGSGLINVLLAGFAVDTRLAESLKQSTGGTDLLILADGRPIASTLPAPVVNELAAPPVRLEELQEEQGWRVLATSLTDMNGERIGQLWFLRSAVAASKQITNLGIQIAAIWAVAILSALLVTFILARHLLRPIRLLSAAASEITRGNYEHRVPLDGDDEMGRLGRAFNTMCASIRQSREDLIRQERINTLGRIATSVVHDLRNPLAAIYSGAELLVDTELLPASHTRRLAANIYRASRQVLTLLDDLMALVRGGGPSTEICRVAELVEDAWNTVCGRAGVGPVRFTLAGDTAAEAPLARARIERVFTNLLANAADAMPGGGDILVRIARDNGMVAVTVQDTGPGVPASIRHSLFHPFTTAGKSNGLGLGLALSRHTVLEHGGDLTLEKSESGACFSVRLPASGSGEADEAHRPQPPETTTMPDSVT